MVVFDELSITPDGKNLIVEAHVNTKDYFQDMRIEGIYINTDDSFSESGLNKSACVAFKKFDNWEDSKIDFYNDNTHQFTLVNPTLYTDEGLTQEALSTLDDLIDGNFKSKRFIQRIIDNKIAIEINYIDEEEENPENKIKGSTLWLSAGDNNLEGLEAGVGYGVITPSSNNLGRSCRWVFNINDFTINGNTLSNNLFFVYVKTIGNPKPCTPCGEDKEYTLGVTFDTTVLYQNALSYIKELNSECGIPRGFIDFILQFEMLKAAIETGHLTVAVKFFNKLFKQVNVKTSNCRCNGRFNL